MTTHGKWISIEDRLPEEKETVIAAIDRGYVCIAFLDYDHEWQALDIDDWLVTKRVTHWMELPPAPGPSMTNADRLDAMTVEEKAEWFINHRGAQRNCPYSVCPQYDDFKNKKKISCRECWLNWLKQEVTE